MSNRTGAIPYQLIAEMMTAGYIKDADPSAIQPSSLDLTLTEEVYRLRGSYLPRPNEKVSQIAKHGALYPANLNTPLEIGGIYLIKLKETFNLPPGIRATTSNKSSCGRIDLRTRLLCDGVPRFDSVPAGYAGELWLEIVPKSFPILLHAGDRLNQIRFFHGDARYTALEHRLLYDRFHLLRDAAGGKIAATDEIVREGITMTINLCGNGPIGWRASCGSSNFLDTSRFDHDPYDFFEPIYQPQNGEITLKPGTFYILATKEKILVPPIAAAEMANYDPSKGEFRSHFAGFFDPGWGWRDNDQERGTAAVLEVEAYGHEFVLRDGQPICLMVYEKLIAAPAKIYGADLNSNYKEQTGPQLAKWFKSPIASKTQLWENQSRYDLG